MAVDKVLAMQTRGPEFGSLNLEPQHQHTKSQVELMSLALALWLRASRASQSSTVAELNRLNRARLMKPLAVSVWLCVCIRTKVRGTIKAAHIRITLPGWPPGCVTSRVRLNKTGAQQDYMRPGASGR